MFLGGTQSVLQAHSTGESQVPCSMRTMPGLREVWGQMEKARELTRQATALRSPGICSRVGENMLADPVRGF